MNAPAFLPIDYRDRAIHNARVELTTVLAYLEHWQRDVEAGLKPTVHTLEKVAANIRRTLSEIKK